MTIKDYIATDLHEVALNCDIKEVKAALDKADCIVILDKVGKSAGLITCTDLVSGAKTARDCDFEKPWVTPDQSILEVTSLMKQTGHLILPVGQDGKITGVIRSNTILYALAESVKKYQLLFRHVTHDLRNPLSNITGIFGLLEENLVKTENIELIELGKSATESALDMLTELLEIEKRDNDTAGFRVTNLSAFTTQCIEQLKGLFIPKDIKLETSFTQADFFAKVNPHHLQRVIHNLLSNAVKFSQTGEVIAVVTTVKNDRFLIAIHDHGIGIPFEMQAFVFDQFTAAQQSGTSGERSTGLGLYFARKTIELHQGRIWFESKVNIGTSFFIEIPKY